MKDDSGAFIGTNRPMIFTSELPITAKEGNPHDMGLVLGDLVKVIARTCSMLRAHRPFDPHLDRVGSERKSSPKSTRTGGRDGRAAMWLKSRPDCTGKIGATGFCYGGLTANMLAVPLWAELTGREARHGRDCYRPGAIATWRCQESYQRFVLPSRLSKGLLGLRLDLRQSGSYELAQHG